MATSEGIPSSIDIEFLELNDNPYIKNKKNMSNITKEINGKEYTFDVTTLDIKLVDYGGFYGTDIRVDVKVKCNNNEDEFSVELCYPMGDAYDYYSEMDYADLAEMFGETAEEIESDFSAWYDKHSDKLETDYVNLFIDECFWEDEEPFQEMVLDELLSDKSDNKDELLALIVSDSDEITTIETDEDFMYIPDFMDDETTDEEFENILEYRKGYPCDGWGAPKEYKLFTVIVNKYVRFEVEMYLSKYAACNYEVGVGWGNIFEYANDMLSKFLSRENIKTIKDLKDYLANNENRILLED